MPHSFPTRLSSGPRASAVPAKGERLCKVGAPCHSFDQGGPNLLGPKLWAVVGRPVGSHGGFNYSAALKAHGGTWSYEALDVYIASPARAIPGNRMGYAGMRRAQDRADLLAWLSSHGSGNFPFPAPKPPAEDQLAGLSPGLRLVHGARPPQARNPG